MFKQQTWKRVAVLFAGPAMNFIICLVLIYGIALVWGLPNPLAGDIEEAKLALQTLKGLVPDISLKSLNGVIPYVRDDDRERYVEGFRLAGLE